VSVKEAHLLGHMGHSQEIHQGQQKTVEHSQHTGSITLAHLTVIFAQGHAFALVMRITITTQAESND